MSHCRFFPCIYHVFSLYGIVFLFVRVLLAPTYQSFCIQKFHYRCFLSHKTIARYFLTLITLSVCVIHSFVLGFTLLCVWGSGPFGEPFPVSPKPLTVTQQSHSLKITL